jgi:NDP-sugar pyrophosphorylase family protein
VDALILAAGRGTRLGALGETSPKALVDVAGRTMLERVAERLVAGGVDRIIINVCHLGEQIEAFVRTHDLGAPVELSHESPDPLETGGGLLHARPLFRGNAPFFLHNVDVWTDADLSAMLRAHERTGAIATVAVHERASSRQLLFDEKGLYGGLDMRKGHGHGTQSRDTVGDTTSVAFAGIHIISPTIFERLSERGVFSIMEPYLRLAGEGERVAPFSIDGAKWLEIGTPERLEAARRAFGE